jgi:chitin disaccharide deacetylase
MSPHLIVNADDFGLTAGVNRAILELHYAGVLTSASIMAQANATEEAIDIARSTPTMGIGCHVVLVDGAPIL